MKGRKEITGRYDRNSPALAERQTVLLRTKHVCVIGCGGIGGYVCETLARVGVGFITAVDADVFEASNLNRQLFCLESNLGKKKADEAAKRIRSVNSSVCVRAVNERLTEQNASDILRGCHLAVDALDNAQDRLILAEACKKEGIPLVHGALSGWSLQVGLVKPGERTLEKLYGNKKNTEFQTEYEQEKTAASLPFTAMAVAALECALAVKLLTAESSENSEDTYMPESGRILSADLRDMDFTLFTV